MKVNFAIGDSPEMDEKIAGLFDLIRRRGFYERQGNRVDLAAPLLQGTAWPSNPYGVWNDAEHDDFWNEITTRVCLGQATFVWRVGGDGTFSLVMKEGFWHLEYRGSGNRFSRQCGTGEAIHARLRSWLPQSLVQAVS